MIEAETDIALGEGFAPAALAHRKLIGGAPAMIVVPALLFAGSLVLAWLISVALAASFPRWRMWTDLVNVAGLIVGIVLALRSIAHRQTRTFIAALRKIGSPPSLRTRYRFDDQGIETQSERASHRVPWSAALFVMPSKDYWLIQADTLTVIVPKRAFAGDAEEQAILDFARDHLDQAALARSDLEKR